MKTDLVTHCPLSQHFWKRFGDGSLHCFTILSFFITNSFIEPERKAPLNDAFGSTYGYGSTYESTYG